jgi:hypothetical protein
MHVRPQPGVGAVHACQTPKPSSSDHPCQVLSRPDLKHACKDTTHLTLNPPCVACPKAGSKT